MSGLLSNPLLVPLAGIVGVVVGALLNGLIVRWNQWAVWRRDDRNRFHQERVAAYAEFVRDANRYALRGRHDTRQPGYGGDSTMPQKTQDYYLAASASYQRTRILGSLPVVAEAEKLWHQVVDIATLPNSESISMNKLMSPFYDAVRKELGITDA